MKADLLPADRLLGRRDGMTLLEIMITVSIIAIMALLAMSASAKARRAAQVTRTLSGLRVAVQSFGDYSFQTGNYPPDAAPGVIPPGMSDYLNRMSWTAATPLGGAWDWVPALPGYGCGVQMTGVLVDETRMAEIDERLDDGNLATGLFRKVDPTNYIYLVEKE